MSNKDDLVQALNEYNMYYRNPNLSAGFVLIYLLILILPILYFRLFP